MPIVRVGKHTVEVKNNGLTGQAIVLYDEQEKARGYSVFGKSYMFQVEEDGEQVTYECESRMALWSEHFIIRRKGIVVFTSQLDRSNSSREQIGPPGGKSYKTPQILTIGLRARATCSVSCCARE